MYNTKDIRWYILISYKQTTIGNKGKPKHDMISVYIDIRENLYTKIKKKVNHFIFLHYHVKMLIGVFLFANKCSFPPDM